QNVGICPLPEIAHCNAICAGDRFPLIQEVHDPFLSLPSCCQTTILKNSGEESESWTTRTSNASRSTNFGKRKGPANSPVPLTWNPTLTTSWRRCRALTLKPTWKNFRNCRSKNGTFG